MTPVTPDYSINGSKAGAASAVPASMGADRTACQENQEKASVTVNGNVMTVSIEDGVDNLNSWASSNPSQGTGAWIALDVATGTNDITKVKYNDTLLTSDDVAEADLWNFSKGHFVLWIKADVVIDTPKPFTLGGEGETKTFTVRVVDAA